MSPYETTFNQIENEVAASHQIQNDLLHHDHARLISNNTPISQLPNEMLAAIFEAGYDRDKCRLPIRVVTREPTLAIHSYMITFSVERDRHILPIC
jgi:hypothetical protein